MFAPYITTEIYEGIGLLVWIPILSLALLGCLLVCKW